MENTNQSFSSEILAAISSNHLLKHPFYQTWSEGKLSKRTLGLYAKQYFHHVDAFPRYISATHSNCSDLKSRQVLLENLTDEEKGDRNHPELWLRFAEGLGVKREDVQSAELNPETKEMIDTFMTTAKGSYAEGLGALFAYESQVPEVAQSKIDGLEEHYDVKSERALDFFQVHLKADVYHTEAAAKLLEELNPEDKEKAKQAAVRASLALWKFLDGVQKEAGDITA